MLRPFDFEVEQTTESLTLRLAERPGAAATVAILWGLVLLLILAWGFHHYPGQVWKVVVGFPIPLLEFARVKKSVQTLTVDADTVRGTYYSGWFRQPGHWEVQRSDVEAVVYAGVDWSNARPEAIYLKLGDRPQCAFDIPIDRHRRRELGRILAQALDVPFEKRSRKELSQG